MVCIQEVYHCVSVFQHAVCVDNVPQEIMLMCIREIISISHLLFTCSAITSGEVWVVLGYSWTFTELKQALSGSCAFTMMNLKNIRNVILSVITTILQRVDAKEKTIYTGPMRLICPLPLCPYSFSACYTQDGHLFKMQKQDT